MNSKNKTAIIMLLGLFITLLSCEEKPVKYDTRGAKPIVSDDDHNADHDHHDMEKTAGTGDVNSWPQDQKLSLTWDKVEHTGLLGYRIYLREDKESDKIPVKDVRMDAVVGFNPESPGFILDVYNNVLLVDRMYEKLCFSVSALSDAGESDMSKESCMQLEPMK